MGIFGNLFGGGNDNLKQFLSNGAQVIDVRTKQEYNSGHVKGSKNIPLNQLDKHAAKLAKAGKPLVLCCASGMRSGNATSLLKREGIECINGGPWTKVRNAIEEVKANR